MNGGYVGEKQRIATASLRDKRAIGVGLDLEKEDIRSISSVENKQNLSDDSLAIVGFECNDLVDAGLEEC